MFRLPLVLLGFTASWAAAESPVDFSRDVLPILSDNCFHCHGPDANARKADLRLDLQEEALRKTDPLIIPGQSGKSEFIRRLITEDASERMPPARGTKKLTSKQIDTLKRWVDAGAPWGQHWAFVPPRRPAVPQLADPKQQARVRNPIDAFVGKRLEREGLVLAPEADRARLIRRVTLDLTGLPPTPEEVDAFVKDTSPLAYEKVVDRLLASPHFGERLAWDWLDAARYADTNGYQGDNERTMWPWRDWVIQAFNTNMPYDRFTIEQIAGDLLPEATREQILATGFNRNHMINGEGGRIAEENRIEYLFDQTETVGTIWLGLTFNCCRCHDHKFDPVSQQDYFRMLAFFNRTPVDGVGRGGQTPPVLNVASPEQEKRLNAAQKAYADMVKQVSPIEKRLRDAAAKTDDKGQYTSTLPAVIESALRKGPNGRVDPNNDELIKHFQDSEPEYVALLKELRKRAKERDAAANAVPKVMVMQEMPKPRETFVLERGAYDKPTDKVTPGVPHIFPKEPASPMTSRLDLARWLVDANNPLTPRVTVNRYWQMLFGTGLVKTVEDFGVQGERPQHQELLDWLAVEFQQPTAPGKAHPWAKARHPWDVKGLLRLIVTSATYQQSSRLTPALHEKDPENRLLARGPRQRMPAWMLRDQALAIAGVINRQQGGPSVKPYQPPGIWEEATFGFKSYTQDHGDALYRRSLYVFWRRIVGPTMFFDSASRQVCTVSVATTNTPLHALATLNDITYVESARVLAERSLKQGGATDANRLTYAFRRSLARAPSAEELTILRQSLERQRGLFQKDAAGAKKLLAVGEAKRDESLDTAEHAAWTVVCSLLLNLDETLTKQ